MQPGFVFLILLAAAGGLDAPADQAAAKAAAAPAVADAAAAPDPPVGDGPSDSPADADIDFARDIQPLLARHCLRCHDERMRLGGLSLIERSHAEIGGNSKRNPLAPGAENELLRRVRSADEDERMPLGGHALSDAEIDLLGRWIAAGAAWPDKPQAMLRDVPHLPPSSLAERLLALVDSIEQARIDRLRPAGFALVGVLVFILVVERLKRRAAQPAQGASLEPAADETAAFGREGILARLARTPRSAYAAALLASVCYGVAAYAWQLGTELAAAQQSLTETQQELSEARSAAVSQSSYDANEIYWPKHPPQLGGFYYRGNDERNARLFNGGIYRTATFHLELRDQSDRPLQRGDKVEGPPNVRLEIRRAPHATPSLFTDSVLSNACLSPIPPPGYEEKSDAAASKPAQQPGSQPARSPGQGDFSSPAEQEDVEPGPTTGGPFLLQPVEPGECWELRATLPAPPAGKPLVGMLYLYPTVKSSADDKVDRPHYAISYRLRLDEQGRLTSDSTLHLGSMYNVPGVVELPPERIAPSDWFDYRPLPEIEGEHTTDPKLLGVEEHLGKAKAEPAEAP